MYVFFIISHIFDSTATFPPSLKEMPGHDADEAAFWSGRTGSRVDWLPLEFKLIRPPRLCVGARDEKGNYCEADFRAKTNGLGSGSGPLTLCCGPVVWERVGRRLKTRWSCHSWDMERHSRYLLDLSPGAHVVHPMWAGLASRCDEVRLFVLRTAMATAVTPSSRPCSGTSRRSPPKKSKLSSGLRRSCSVFLVMNVSSCFVICFHIVCSVQ